MAEDIEGVSAAVVNMDEESDLSSGKCKYEDDEGGGELFDVERIVGMSKNGGKALYKVRWRGYPPSHDTWEPVENLESCLDMIEDFQSKREEMKKKRAEERRKKQALMEGRVPDDFCFSPVSSVTTTDSSSPLQDEGNSETTLKDTFWKDLEEGKVNLFATDMYSKVKGQGRASRPTSFKQIFSTGKCSSPPHETHTPTTRRRKSDSGTTSANVNNSGSKKKAKNLSSPSNRGQSRKTLTKKSPKTIKSKANICESECVSNDSNDSALTRSSINSDMSVTTPQSVSSENPSSEFDSGVFDSSLNKTCDSPDDRKLTDTNSNCTSETVDKCKRKTPQRGSPRSSDGDSKSANLQRRDSEEYIAVKRHKQDNIHNTNNKLTSSSNKLMFETVHSFECSKENLDETRQNIVSHLSDLNSSKSKPPKCLNIVDKNCNKGAKTVQELTQPLGKLLSESYLNLSPESTGGRNQDKAYDIDFEVDLDEVDIDDLDRQISFSPSSNPAELTNEELKQAVLEGDYELLKRAFSSMKIYDLEQLDEDGNTLLMTAVLKSYDDVCEMLVYHGAKVNAKNKQGCTALMLACEKCDICTVTLLIEIGANLNIQQSNGETGLIKAVKRGDKQITQCLLEAGANFALQSVNGYSALTFAKTLRHFDVEDIMIEHISRLTTEFDKQVALTLNNTARIITALFPIQCFPLKEGNKFVIDFKHVMEPLHPGVGFLLFISHARIKRNEIKCRFYGPCAVTEVILNGVKQPTLTENANFVLSCHPLLPGKNELCIHTESAPLSKAKLVVCAYKAQLMTA